MGQRGPKKGTKYKVTQNRQQVQNKIQDFVNKLIDPVLRALYERCVGIAIIDKKDDTGQKIYDVEPDTAAIKLFLEYGAGKPTQNLDVTTLGQSLNFTAKEEVEKRIAKLK